MGQSANLLVKIEDLQGKTETSLETTKRGGEMRIKQPKITSAQVNWEKQSSVETGKACRQPLLTQIEQLAGNA